jgi:hypothetical protein
MSGGRDPRADLAADQGPNPGGDRVPGTTAAPASVADVLRTTSPSIVEGHLTWLVHRTRREPQLSPQRVLYEDQSKILIDALEEQGAHDVVARTLGNLWIPDDVPDADDAVATYGAALGRVTSGQPGYSPYVALAQSAARYSAQILNHRRSTDEPRSA